MNLTNQTQKIIGMSPWFILFFAFTSLDTRGEKTGMSLRDRVVEEKLASSN